MFANSVIGADPNAGVNAVKAQQVPTANIIRTPVVLPGRQNNQLQKQWKFTLTQALPYDVVLVQRIQYTGLGVVPNTNQVFKYSTFYFEEIGTILHGETQIVTPNTNPPVPQPFDDSWWSNVANVLKTRM